ncbi:MAG: hypothetical protein ACO1O3_06650 [Sphingobium sp.]|jgi:hypothetical protein
METMMAEDGTEYFRRRAREERERADAAADSCARRAHERIAAEYERRIRHATEPKPRPVAG